MEGRTENPLAREYRSIMDQLAQVLTRLPSNEQESFKPRINKQLAALKKAVVDGNRKKFDQLRDKFYQLMDEINQKLSAVDKLKLVQQEVDDVRKVMENNIEAILERGETLDKLIEDTDRLESGSNQFKKNSAYANSFFSNHKGITIAIIGAVCAIATFGALVGTEAMAIIPAGGIALSILLLGTLIGALVGYLNQRSVHESIREVF